jgi:hypothetical protein
VLYGLWNRFIQNRSQFFVDRGDDFCTIRCMTSFGGSSVSPARRLAMKQFGAVAALLLIYGQTPRPLSPAVMLFITYNFDIHCLTPGFIGEWFAGLRVLLSNWLETGPGGDPEPFASHFATYHDAQVCCHTFLLYCQIGSNYHLFSHLPIETVTWLCTSRSPLICYTRPPLVVTHIVTQNG